MPLEGTTPPRGALRIPAASSIGPHSQTLKRLEYEKINMKMRICHLSQFAVQIMV